MKKPIVIVLLTLALVFVLAGIGAVIFFASNGFSISSLDLDGPKVSATSEETQTLKVDGAVTLTVLNDAGEVSVTGADVEDVTVEIVKRGYGRNQAEADASLEDIKYEIEQDGNTISLTFDYPELERQIEQQVDFIVTVPFETTLEVDASFGKLTAMDIQGDVRLYNHFGNMVVSGVDGALDMKTDSGLISVTAVKAVNKDISVNSGFGSANIEQVNGANITIESKSGALDLKNVRATKDLKLSTNFGSIDFESGAAQTLTAETQSGKVTLTSVTVSGVLTIRDDFGDIELEQVNAKSYDAETKSGTITIDGAQGQIRAHSGFGGIKVNNAENATIDLDTQSGTVEFSGTLGEGPHSAHSDFGEIKLNLPADSELSIDLETEFGNITSDIPITVTLTGDIKKDQQSGSMNGGGAEFKVSTSSGNITIKILE